MPSACGGDDPVGIGSPDERLGAAVVFGEKTVDRGLQIDKRTKDATFEAAARELGEEAFDGVQPGGGGRREVKCPARMSNEPGSDFGMLMAGVVVEDHVDQPASRNLAFDAVEEAQKLLVPVGAACIAR